MPQRHRQHHTRGASVAACAFAIRGEASEIQLFPAGRFSALDGRPGDTPWLLDADTAARVIARAAERLADIVIDYEHQTLETEFNGQPAPAAGWFAGSALEWRDGEGLFATGVEWTERARAMITAGEYRYLSPVFLYLPETGEVLEILHVGLTNTPALDGLPALAEQAAARLAVSHQEDATVDELKKLLGLAQNATDAQAQHALTALKDKLAETLGTEQHATAESIGEAAAALKAKADQLGAKDREIASLKAGAVQPDPAKFAPVETVVELQGELAALRSAQTERDVTELVNAGLNDGRLLPAQADWAKQLGKSDIAALKSYLETAAPIAALRGSQTGGKTPPGGGNEAGQLTESQRAVCAAMGVDEDAYKKQLGIGDTAAAAAQ